VGKLNFPTTYRDDGLVGKLAEGRPLVTPPVQLGFPTTCPGPQPKPKPVQELPPLQLFAARLLLPMLQQRLLALDLQAGTHRGVWHVHGAGG